jgi:hypothetical protein
MKMITWLKQNHVDKHAWMTQHDEIATHGLILAILTLVAWKKHNND